MENLTNQVLKLASGKQNFVIRQESYKGVTYFLAAEITPDGEDFTNNFLFFENINEDGKSKVKEVKDPAILEVLAKNIKLD